MPKNRQRKIKRECLDTCLNQWVTCTGTIEQFGNTDIGYRADNEKRFAILVINCTVYHEHDRYPIQHAWVPIVDEAEIENATLLVKCRVKFKALVLAYNRGTAIGLHYAKEIMPAAQYGNKRKKKKVID